MKLASLVRDVPPIVGEALFLEARGKLNLSTNDSWPCLSFLATIFFFCKSGLVSGIKAIRTPLRIHGMDQDLQVQFHPFGSISLSVEPQ